jgi:hypothetical protein
MFRKTNVKSTFENFHLQNVLFLHFYCLEKHVAHAHTQDNPEGVKWPLVTSGSHGITTKKKAGKKPGMRRTYFKLVPLQDRASSGQVTDVTPPSEVSLEYSLRRPHHITIGNPASYI